MKHVYILDHQARNSNWIEVYATYKDAKAKVKRLMAEHEGYGVIFDIIDVNVNDAVYQSENDEVYIYITKEKLL